MSDEIEALLRSGMAERVDTAPVFDDPGLADAAIAGAGRIRRRRRVGAAASGAGLLVLGAAVVVWHPWSAQVHEGDDVLAADTSTTEAQHDLDMEFVAEGDGGGYEVVTRDNERIPLGGPEEEPIGVYRLTDSYLTEGAETVWMTSFDGEELGAFPKPSQETYLSINEAGEEFAMITPAADYADEEHHLFDVTVAGGADAAAGQEFEPVSFTTSFDLTLLDWTDATAVFSADLYNTTGGDSGSYYFNDQFDWGMETVSAAGFESAVFVDNTDPNYLCVADLNSGDGTVVAQEQCGPADSVEVDEYLAVASGGASDPLDISSAVVEAQQGGIYPLDGMDLGEYQTRFEESQNWLTDPLRRWQLAYNRGDRTWLLLESGAEAPSELDPPSGAILPVLSYT